MSEELTHRILLMLQRLIEALPPGHPLIEEGNKLVQEIKDYLFD